MSTPAIELTHISKRFKRAILRNNYVTLKDILLRKRRPPLGKRRFIEVLEDISLAIPKGKTIGIIGKNGSGKSTLLKLIAGIYRPDSGHITVNGKLSSLIELGAGFHPEFTGRENVFINGILLGLNKTQIRDRFDSIVQFAELEDFIDMPVRTYSSGMYMRLGFSVAVHVDPEIMLVDEVLAVGDESFGHKCKEIIRQFRAAGKTIVMVTHDMGAVERWCDEAIWLNQGQVVDIGEPRQVIDQYRKQVKEDEEETFEATHRAGTTLLGERWGDRQIEITAVKLLSENGEETSIYTLGEPTIIEINYTIHQQPVQPVAFGIGIFSADNICCFGTNTEIEKIPVPLDKSKGIVRFIITQNNLIEGTYYLDVAVHAEDGFPFDYLKHQTAFAIRSNIKDVGIFRLPHKWEINPG
jgi:ABC-type polysaccharide/polyol phosphate transport system ATPase subunit